MSDPYDPYIFPQPNSTSPVFKNLTETQSPRLRQGPQPTDRRLANNDPNQTFNDCRTIDGWMNVISKLIKAAWANPDGSVDAQFTHDYALLPKDPQDLKGVIIVWDMVSMVPAHFGSHREIKPRVREVVPRQVMTSKQTANGRRSVGERMEDPAEWIWAQSFDVTVKFSVYGDSYARKNEYVEKFLDLMLTYTKVFKQAGLQECMIRGILQEALYDPPRNEEYPNQSILYDARIERQTPASYTAIQQVLVTAGIINPVDNSVGPDSVIGTVSGITESPILPDST